ncbi:bacteriocin immunity protein [Marinobacter shengliensis]|uniref:bacteriocin immunity protein n=1 Tax=Marinobacter shengliensis TaxID=1389223 RepID=UPI0011088537
MASRSRITWVQAIVFSATQLSQRENRDGSIFNAVIYPEDSEDSTPERIVEIVEQWRARNGLPGFKSAELCCRFIW